MNSLDAFLEAFPGVLERPVTVQPLPVSPETVDTVFDTSRDAAPQQVPAPAGFAACHGWLWTIFEIMRDSAILNADIRGRKRRAAAERKWRQRQLLRSRNTRV